jgi:hypothetical protein
MVEEATTENTPAPMPTRLEISADLARIRCALAVIVEHLTAPDAPKSRERSLVITKCEEAFFFAGEGLRKE